MGPLARIAGWTVSVADKREKCLEFSYTTTSNFEGLHLLCSSGTEPAVVAEAR